MMVLSYILLITWGTMYHCLKTDFILNRRFTVITGQLIPKAPQGFEEKESKWNNYFLFEPNLYIGVNF